MEKAALEVDQKVASLERQLAEAKRTIDRKQSEFEDREAYFISELEDARNQYEEKVAEQSKDKDSFKQKLLHNEYKHKEIENRRASLLFDFEKERSQWNVEAEKLKAKNSEVQEQLDRAERKTSQLQREIEKLRNS